MNRASRFACQLAIENPPTSLALQLRTIEIKRERKKKSQVHMKTQRKVKLALINSLSFALILASV